MKIKLISSVYIFVPILILLLFSNVYSVNKFVNPISGSDNNIGTIQSPLRTLWKAGQFSYNNNDTVFIRGGHYVPFKDSIQRANSNNKIIIMPYYNETVILDGKNYPFNAFFEAVLRIQSSSNIEIKNLIIRNNSVGPGISVVSDASISRFISIINCRTDSTERQGILVQGKDILVQGCEISNAVRRNAGGILTGGWDCGLQAYPYPLSIGYCENITFTNNIVSKCWGEGIATIRGNNFLIENNKISDCFSVGIYADNSYNGIIRNNWVYSTNDIFNRVYPNGYSAPASGVFWAAEGNSYVLNQIVENIDIYNNFFYRTGPAFGWFDDTNNNFANDSYRNIRIYYNTVFETKGYQSFYIDDEDINPNRVTPTNCEFKNNIICRAKYNNNYQQYFTNSQDYSISWEINNNCFINGFPAGFVSNNIQGSPSFIDSTINLPQNFKVHSNSISRYAGVPIQGITHDYFANLRTISPTIGFYEYTEGTGIYFNGNQTSNSFVLQQNYPNPFNPVTNINFDLPKFSNVKLKVYNTIGKNVATLVNEELSPGRYNYAWDASNFASGVYFYRLEAGEFTDVKRMVVVK